MLVGSDHSPLLTMDGGRYRGRKEGQVAISKQGTEGIV